MNANCVKLVAVSLWRNSQRLPRTSALTWDTPCRTR